MVPASAEACVAIGVEAGESLGPSQILWGKKRANSSFIELTVEIEHL